MIPLYYKASLLLTGVFSLLVALLLRAYAPKEATPARLLSRYFALLAYPVFLTYLVASGLIYEVPHLYRTGIIAIFCYIPVGWMYMRSVTGNGNPSWRDAWHFLPPLIYILDFTPFFLWSGAEKMKALQSGGLGYSIILFRESAVFPAGFYLTLKYGLAAFYWFLQLRLLRSFYQPNDGGFREKNKKLITWLMVFLTCQVTTFIIPPLSLLGEEYAAYEYMIYLFMIGGICALAAAALFFFPEFLYQLKHPEGITENTSTFAAAHIYPGRTKPPGLTQEKQQEIAAAIREHFSLRQPFLQQQYTLPKLSLETGIPAQYISLYMNEEEKMNFNDFVNTYRIRYCLTLMNGEDAGKYTLETLARQSGFNNRNTFTQAFKKVTGATPSAYARNLQKGNF
ncbi:helix-turn-helix domain-containing protein [Flavihumibacter petaseus]|uniref:Putative AraC family transcriptional regulator n=1 Tax=Flavihumibacter petaseus NBRC 106054 TaxID=1220578 RepID=A0A0E9N139_9BACT|nr:AraC family transcriptional regulator [Flavihumibacter petaseus]GAO43065.1 putative AraC family transcriptional regulator [Flavihumibacter petaseus NBRC 106054]